VDGNRFGDAFASGESGADELVGVASVDLCAGRADGSAPVPASGVDHAVGQVRGVDYGEDLAGFGIDIVDPAT
jgi:hypothetical protein